MSEKSREVDKEKKDSLADRTLKFGAGVLALVLGVRVGIDILRDL